MSLPEIGFRIRNTILSNLQSCGAFAAGRVPEPDLNPDPHRAIWGARCITRIENSLKCARRC